MRFYDTMTRTVDEFVPLEPGKVRMYSCGPTVYRYAHIGNLRTFITADLLRRVLEFEGNEVRQVCNITDVGHMTDEVTDEGVDRMLLGSEDEGLTPEEIAEKYTKAYIDDTAAMNIQEPAVRPKATEHIAEMIDMIQTLIEKGHAYEVDGMVYFDVDSFPAYGRLSKNTRDALKAGHRSETVADPRRKNHYDFTLWRAAGDRRLMKWDSPWGPGFPGWHIECSAMSLKHLGERFDIHTGGSDNIFPHHEDEIAQSEGALGHEVVGRWLHGHHLLADGRKMSKSSKNFYTVADLRERGFDPLSFRYLVLQSRYRGQMNFTWEALESAQRGLDKLRRQMAEWASSDGDLGLSEAGKGLDARFGEAVGDDLDTPRALVVVSELVSSDLAPAEKFQLLKRWDLVLGLDLTRELEAGDAVLPDGAAARIEERELARQARDWATADRLRSELAAQGVSVTDTPTGPVWTVGPKP
jgi:cysteinyl-tRNA synthetase